MYVNQRRTLVHSGVVTNGQRAHRIARLLLRGFRELECARNFAVNGCFRCSDI
jgi:hypothetical protein